MGSGSLGRAVCFVCDSIQEWRASGDKLLGWEFALWPTNTQSPTFASILVTTASNGTGKVMVASIGPASSYLKVRTSFTTASPATISILYDVEFSYRFLFR